MTDKHDLLAAYLDPRPTIRDDDSPLIDVARLDAEKFMAVVLWLHGLSTRQIAGALKILEGAAQHPTRERRNGGYLPRSRKDMTRQERQMHLDYLKANRRDEGKLPDMFYRVK